MTHKDAKTFEWEVVVHSVGVIGKVTEHTRQEARFAALRKFGEEGNRSISNKLPHIYENDYFSVNMR